MELRRLRLLHEFAQRGTIAATAEGLGYSPSSVSVQLSQLEREAGVALLHKAGRNVELTEAGHRLAQHAAQALAADEAVRAELATRESEVRGNLRMAFVQTPALALLPGVLDHLSRSAPKLEVEVVHRETAPALHELRSRAVDLVVGIEYGPVPVARTQDVHRQDLLHEDLLLSRRRDPFTAVNPEPVRIGACENEVWACGQPGSGMDALLRNVCNRLGHFEPDIRHRSDDGLILSALVASGRTVALLPALLVSAVPVISAVPIAEEPLRRTIFAATRVSLANAPSIAAARHALRDTATLLAESQPRISIARAGE